MLHIATKRTLSSVQVSGMWLLIKDEGKRMSYVNWLNSLLVILFIRKREKVMSGLVSVCADFF